MLLTSIFLFSYVVFHGFFARVISRRCSTGSDGVLKRLRVELAKESIFLEF